MIINCPNCNKQFKISSSLMPDNGRHVKCGSCDHIWFHKIEDNIDNKIVDNINEPNDVSLQKDIENKKEKITEKQISVKNKIKKDSSGKFFSYLLVLIISFVALTILIDTLKVPLINIFPGLEIILFNLFEILKDIKLFIIDLY